MIFIDACLGKNTPHTPIWMMRQAGRYLPEYKELRATTANFVEFCRNSKKASEATLQPINRFDIDAAIIFSDILVVPLEMGMALDFKPGVGPVFANPLESMQDLDKLKPHEAADKLNYVYEALELTRAKLPEDKALIGFCGAPWTLVTYMIEGKGTKTYTKVKKMLYSNPQLLHSILRKVTGVLKDYVANQIKAGANAIQIFDSWGGALEKNAYLEFSWSYMQELMSYIKSEFPNIPIIAFPKGTGTFIENLDGDFDVLGIDWNTPIQKAKKLVGDKFVLQGNMEPCRLYDTFAIQEGVDEILSTMKGKRHIFNLGHGILPDIPLENVEFFINYVKKESQKYCK